MPLYLDQPYRVDAYLTNVDAIAIAVNADSGSMARIPAPMDATVEVLMVAAVPEKKKAAMVRTKNSSCFNVIKLGGIRNRNCG